MRFFGGAFNEMRASVAPEMENDYRRIMQDLKQENPRGRQDFAALRDSDGRQPTTTV